jgi:hypothetical protein
MGATLKDDKQPPLGPRDVDYKKFALEMKNAADYDATNHILSGLNAKGLRMPVKGSR